MDWCLATTGARVRQTDGIAVTLVERSLRKARLRSVIDLLISFHHYLLRLQQ